MTTLNDAPAPTTLASPSAPTAATAPATAPSRASGASSAAPHAASSAASSTGQRGARGPAALLVLGSCTSLQIGAALATRLFPATGATGSTLLRLGIAAVVLLAVARPRVRDWSRSQWTAVVLLGLSLAGMNAFFYEALSRIPLGVAVTVEFLGPLSLAAALSHRLRDLGWVLLALVGVVVLGVTGGSGAHGHALDAVGIGFTLVAAVFWACYVQAAARAGAAVPGRGGLAVAMTVAALVLVPAGARGAAHVAGQPHLLPVAFGTAVLASVVPYSLELAALRRIPRHTFGILLSLEPAVATLSGLLLLGQRIGPAGLGAVAAVVLASVGSTLSSPTEASAASPTPVD